MKQIVVLMGSPRRGGNTELLAAAFREGAEHAGHHVETIYVSEKEIHGCIGCNACKERQNHACVFDDDMRDCYPLLAQADVIVVATPIYFYGVSGQLKCLIDRLHNPVRNDFRVKKLGLLAVCADTRDAVFDAVATMYHAVLQYFSLTDGGRVTVYGVSEKGDIAGRPELADARSMGENI